MDHCSGYYRNCESIIGVGGIFWWNIDIVGGSGGRPETGISGLPIAPIVGYGGFLLPIAESCSR